MSNTVNAGCIVWHAASHSQIWWFPQSVQRPSTKVEKVVKELTKHPPEILLTAPSHVPHPRQTLSSPHKRLFFTSYLQNVATLNEAGISTPTGSVLCTVRPGLRLWSQTGGSCRPSCRRVTWYRGSAVPGWSSSCQIFSYFSSSSSFCG